MKKVYVFQESKIWEGGNPVDESRPKRKIVAGDETRARRKLPIPSLGRSWVLVESRSKAGS